ncbi:MAG: type IV pilin protein [Erysipelotrichaceae bacterium]
MNKVKNKKGFTLVELIVVIAVLAVLAVIMVPAFTGYVAKSKDASAQTEVQSFCSAYEVAYVDQALFGDMELAHIIDGLGFHGKFHIEIEGYTYTKSGATKTYKAIGNNGSCSVTIL